MYNGLWLSNITCKRCRFRHPEIYSCGEAKDIAAEHWRTRAELERLAILADLADQKHEAQMMDLEPGDPYYD
jgi:C4-type Zn-finger protein